MSFRNSELWRTFIKEAFNVPVKLVKFCCMLHITRTYILDFAYVHTLFLSQIHISIKTRNLSIKHWLN